MAVSLRPAALVIAALALLAIGGCASIIPHDARVIASKSEILIGGIRRFALVESDGMVLAADASRGRGSSKRHWPC
jgi:hypothetical protein